MSPAASGPLSSSARTRVAIVTGGAQGIGRAIALRLASDGLDIAVDDLPSKSQLLENVVNEIKNLGRKCISLTYDVTKENDVIAMVDDTVAQLGRLDVMIANAGVSLGSSKIINADIDVWEKMWTINIRGVVLCYKHAARQMIKQGDGGRMIGAGSVGSLKGFSTLGGYCISKASVRSITHTAAIELGEYGITVNAYAPGIIETPLTTARDTGQGEPCSAIKKLLNLPDAKTGQPEYVASLVSHLASVEAHFITGQTVCVDGGIYFN